MEQGHQPIGGIFATIGFAIMSFVFKGGIVEADKYVLNPLAHTVSIICGTCGIISFLFVLHPPLKDWLMGVVSGTIERVRMCIELIRLAFKRK